MKSIRLTILATFLSITAGCASTPPQQPVAFAKPEMLKDSSITLVMAEVPTPTMTYPGAACILCIGVAAAANSDLSSHVKSLPNDDLIKLRDEVTKSLSLKGIKVINSDVKFAEKKLKKYKSKAPNSARKDYTALKDQYSSSHLLVINFTRVGISRNYANYIPTTDPYVIVSGAAYMVNLETNTYEWYLPLEENNYADGNWKESPDFPGLTNTYYESVERVREAVLSDIEKI